MFTLLSLKAQLFQAGILMSLSRKPYARPALVLIIARVPALLTPLGSCVTLLKVAPTA